MKFMSFLCALVMTCVLIGCGGGSSEEEKIGRDIEALIAESKSPNKDPAAGLEKGVQLMEKMAAIEKRIDALPKDKQKALRDYLVSGKK